MAHIPLVLASFREHAGSKTLSRKDLFWQERYVVLERLFASPEIPDTVKLLKKGAYAAIFSACFVRIQHQMSESEEPLTPGP